MKLVRFIRQLFKNTAFQVVISLLLVYVLIKQVSAKAPWDAFCEMWNSGHVQWKYGLIAILLIPLNWGLEAFRWRYLLKDIVPLSITEAAKSVLAGVTAGFITPGRIGEYAGRWRSIPTSHFAQATTAQLIGSAWMNIIVLLLGYIVAMQFPVWRPAMITAGWVMLIFAILLIVFRSRATRFLQQQPWMSNQSLWTRQDVGTVGFITSIRYIVFVSQYVAWTYCWVGERAMFSVQSAYELSALTLGIQVIAPFPALFGVLMRSEIALQVWTTAPLNEISILLASFSLWLGNIVLPGLAGIPFLIRQRERRSLD